MIPRKTDFDKIPEDVRNAISIANLCQALRCLPRAGGLLDQDSRDVWILETVLAAQSDKEQREIDKDNRKRIGPNRQPRSGRL